VFFLQKPVCQYILSNYAYVGSVIVSRIFIQNTSNMHNLAIAKKPAALSFANLSLNLVSDNEDKEFLGDYELEDDD
jgi:hypothetical protein